MSGVMFAVLIFVFVFLIFTRWRLRGRVGPAGAADKVKRVSIWL
jgi:hypothetical protein